MPSNAPAVFLRQATLLSCLSLSHVRSHEVLSARKQRAPVLASGSVGLSFDPQSCLLRGRIDTGASRFRPTRRPCRHRHDSWTHVPALLFKASAGQQELMWSNIGAEVYYFCVECHAPGPSPGTPGGFQTGPANEARNPPGKPETTRQTVLACLPNSHEITSLTTRQTGN